MCHSYTWLWVSKGINSKWMRSEKKQTKSKKKNEISSRPARITFIVLPLTFSVTILILTLSLIGILCHQKKMEIITYELCDLDQVTPPSLAFFVCKVRRIIVPTTQWHSLYTKEVHLANVHYYMVICCHRCSVVMSSCWPWHAAHPASQPAAYPSIYWIHLQNRY